MRLVSGRFVVTGTSGSSPGPWTIDGNFFDGTGNFGPGDVAVGNAFFLYDGTAGTVRYKITNITTASNPMEFDVEWDDTPGTEIDPPLDVGIVCAINDSSDTPEEPSYQLQSVAEELVSGLRAQTNRKPIEHFGWKKYLLSFGEFSTAANTVSIPLFDLPPNVILEKAIVKHTTAFGGGAISAYTLEVGILGEEDRYTSAFDVFQAVSDTAQLTSLDDAVESFFAPTTVYATATSVGDTLDQANAGAAYVLIKLGTIQD